MANIFDYMQWRDIPLTKTEFNEIDNLILARFSYFPLDNEIIHKNEKITIKESYRRYKEKGSTGRILQKEDTDLYPILANSQRFGELYISDFENKIDEELEKQFSAITIHLPNNYIYVAYRGTDNTIIGWREDLNMCFSDTVPSQIDATNYLNKIAEKYNNSELKIFVGGHSKGGNLAIYASAFCKKDIQNKIINVYNNDGPGFSEKIAGTQEYTNILNKIQTFMPQTSIIGRLLNHKEKITILQSTQTGIMQHDLYSWQVLADHFVKDDFTSSSEFIDQTISNWLIEVSSEQRKEFVRVLFEILNSTQAETLSQISSKWLSNAKTMIKSYQQLDEKSKEALNKTIAVFMKVGRENAKLELKNKAEHRTKIDNNNI